MPRVELKFVSDVLIPDIEINDDLIPRNSNTDSNWWLESKIFDIFSIKLSILGQVVNKKTNFENIRKDTHFLVMFHDHYKLLFLRKCL